MSSASSMTDEHSDSATSYDPADPFAFLLAPSSGLDNSSMEDSSSSSHESPPDWSQFSNLWDSEEPVTSGSGPALHANPAKPDISSLDFGLSLPLDLNLEMEFNPAISMSIDPSALHFDPRIFSAQAYPALQGSVIPSQPQPQAQFSQLSHFTNAGGDSQMLTLGTGRRMSITSSSSSSGASFSPVLGHATASSSSVSDSPADSPAPSSDHQGSVDSSISRLDPADELADRVRQAAGVTLAVPVQGQAQQHQHITASQKLPIPRLPRPASTVTNKRKSPSPSTSDSTTPSTPVAGSVGPTMSVSGRPKTSHTTIERRYRTNLNARIQSLKDAVPALRVLDRGKGKAKKGNEVEPGPQQDEDGDVVDERGYVDGVKVARKISKANVLGKAAEYIRVLKRREMRLMREQAGLRTLIAGLVGGPALLREWEREWVARFGGPERDEVDGAFAESDDDDEGDSEDEDEEGRAKKKIKSAPKSRPKKAKEEAVATGALGATGVVPEKRKRGRPRKIQPPIDGVALVAPPVAAPPPVQPAQYLLAAFAFFSFFNSPLTSSHSSPRGHHAHAGTVLTPMASAASDPTGFSWGWRDVVQVFHLLVSAAVLLSIIVPFLPSLGTLSLPAFMHITSEKRKLTSPAQSPARSSRISTPFDRAALVNALSPSRRGTADEALRLRNALGLHTGLGGIFGGLLGMARGRSGKQDGFEPMQLEQRAWVRLGELAVLDPATTFGTRIQAYWGMLARTSAFNASPGDLATLALLVRPLWRSRAEGFWTRAARARVVRPFERAVVGGMSIDEAAHRVASLETREMNPLGALAVMTVREGVRRVAGRMFVRAVLSGRDADGEAVYDAEKEAREEDERRDVVDAGRSMGGTCAELVGLLERVTAGIFVRHEDVFPSEDDDEDDQTEHDARMLLGALVVYRRLFPSSLSGGAVPVILSPPPSPSPKTAGLRAVLRVALDSDVFNGEGEEANGLEDAKDHVVDMLVAADWEGRRRV
ncbi:hypothetical protein BV25DRAFT_1914055 [Artomyces pyxidatus]|uniref:Uncharacterized protein n=1 Tax=Artomyces pyxidatus TaxID=48021 RepID=A0ACB8T8X6_9AGAM|nr:hypothetical protein BV25DRAFT_1914055 [Artomyces pyxidatus]